jgi:hypothetical protein
VGHRLRLWLLSDLLILDRWLRPGLAAADVAGELGAALGVTLAAAEDPANGHEPVRRESWHRGWGLPRSTLLGLAAGSVFAFEVVAGTVAPAAVRRLHLAGLGLRRAEGYGQVLLDDPVLDLPAEALAVRKPSPAAPVVPAGDGDVPLLRAAERAAWTVELHRVSEAVAATAEGRDTVLGAGHERVPRSQLGALRGVVAALPGQSAQPWLESLTATERRERSWPPTVRRRLGELLTEVGQVWDTVALPEADLTVASAPQALREELWPVAVRTVVGDCLTALLRAGEQR